jgi:hypothetical protein
LVCVSEVARALVEQGVADHPDAGRAWSDLTAGEQSQVLTYVGHAVTGHGKKQRAHQMVGYLELGADSVRAYFAPLRWLPDDTGNSGRIVY